jgi:Arm DNA-binding domain
MALTATAISHAKGKEKPYKLADSGGLYLLVNSHGSRYWRFNYRFEGKFKTLAFGVYPDVSLADARAKRDAAREVLAAGDDPVERREHERRESKLLAGETFEKIIEEWSGLVTVLCRSLDSLRHLGFERERTDAAQI